MLTRPHIRIAQRTGQKGVILVIALIVLVAMTLAAIALIRSVGTSNIVAGNLAFQQSAVRSGDTAIETAVSWLENCSKGGGSCAIGTLDFPDGTHGYTPSGKSNTPTQNQSWDAYWRATLDSRKVSSGSSDSAGNQSYYVIDRLCESAGAVTTIGTNCTSSTLVGSGKGNPDEPDILNLDDKSLVYYRITVRTEGPRRTVSYVQVMVAL
jgi:type IV pilus assembly protein PilX